MEVLNMEREVIEERELIIALSKRIVEQTDRNEIEIFDELIEDYFFDPTPPNLSNSGGNNALGFGEGALMIASTPAAAAVAKVALVFIGQVIVEATKDLDPGEVYRYLRTMLSRESGNASEAPADNANAEVEEPSVGMEQEQGEVTDIDKSDEPVENIQSDSNNLPLTTTQLRALRQITTSEAKRYGMDDTQATAMVNATLVALMLGSDLVEEDLQPKS
jgi:hypothetical protein